MIFLKVHINFSPALQEGGWVGGGKGRVEREKKTSQVRGPESPTDGPAYTTRPKGHHSGQGYIDPG